MKETILNRLLHVLCMVLVSLVAVNQARAQANNACSFGNVDVEVFPLEESARPLQRQLLNATTEFLESINYRSVETELEGIQVSSTDRQLLGTACTLHERYKVLVIPVISPDRAVSYQIRGLHLTNVDLDQPQLALSFNRDAELERVEILDEADRAESWQTMQDEVGSLASGLDVLNLIKELEEAYNTDAAAVANGASTMPNLARLLQNAEINVSKLKNGEPERVPYPSSSRYITRLVSLIRGAGGAPSITYELVNVYPHTDALGTVSTSLYRVTLIQHWMFPPGGYLDTDYVSLDIELTNNTFVRSRNAGRGSFTIVTNPDGVQVTEFNGQNWRSRNFLTPFSEVINAPWQYHYVTLENVWYEPVIGVISPDQVLGNSEVAFDMEHKPGQIQLTILPDAENATVSVETGTGSFVDVSFVNEGILTIPVNNLKGVPAASERISSNERQVRLQISKPNYELKDTTVVLPDPSPQPVVITLQKLMGQLAVTSTPTPSDVIVDNQMVGQTPYQNDFEVTDPDAPLSLAVTNDACLQNDVPGDCVLHIPSETRDIQIIAESTTDAHFDLVPFVVRNLTNDASIQVSLNRNEEVLTMDVEIEDNKGRDRKYVVDFELQDSQSWQPVQDLSSSISSCTTESACVGNGVRPGRHVMEWGLSDALSTSGTSTVPVLTLRKKGLCWPCVLIPAAAGVAAAYIFPRTGSGGPLPFLPPPRP